MESTQQVLELDSYQEMFAKAAEAAVASMGRPVVGVFYQQGGRRFLSASLPVPALLSLVRRDSATKKGDPAEARNRPLDNGHVKEITNYLTAEKKYLVPPIMLNSSQGLQIFAFRTPGETKPCVFVLPFDAHLYVTDGQHRLEALRRAAESRPDLRSDSVGVTIIEEADIDKVHQDFFDAAQVKPLAQALLVEYDGREPLNRMAKDIITESTIFQGRIERIGSVGKNSLMLFTNNQVKQAILQLVVGDWSLYGDALQKQAEEAIIPAASLWRGKIIAFFEEFTRTNPQWNEVAQRPLEMGMITDIPGLRENFLHFTGGGLLVLCGIGHAILDLDHQQDGRLSEEQKQRIRSLAELDWSRDSALWAGSIVGAPGKITPHKSNVVLAVARAKDRLGLPVTAKEKGAIERAEALAAQREQEPALIS